MLLSGLKKQMTLDLYNMSMEEAHEKGICLQCKQPAIPKCYSKAGKREYKISGLCEECFDSITEY